MATQTSKDLRNFDPSRWSTAYLKSYCERQNLPTSGKKEILVARLVMCKDEPIHACILSVISRLVGDRVDLSSVA